MRLRVRTVYSVPATDCFCSVWRSTPTELVPSLSVVTTELAGRYHCSSWLPSSVRSPVRIPVAHLELVYAGSLNSSWNIRSHCAPPVSEAGGVRVALLDGELG